jgi:hypothetical protein
MKICNLPQRLFTKEGDTQKYRMSTKMVEELLGITDWYGFLNYCVIL